MVAKIHARLSGHGLRTALANVVLALVYGVFVAGHVGQFAATQRPSLVLIVLVESIILAMALARKDASATWHTWQTWLTTCGGTFAPLLFQPGSGQNDVPAAVVVQIAGLCLQTGAICALNRSFGLLPAHREVKSNGLYRVVRHPLYAAYTVSHVGYVLNNPTAWNVVVFVAAVALQVMRIRYEESFLMRFDAYAAYARRTRWRLIPGVW